MKKIMALGDTLTLGVRSSQAKDSGIGGYRLPLWNALNSNGFKVDFVGGLNHANTFNETSPVTFDSDHMGIPRWSIEDILTGIDPDGPLQTQNTTLNNQNVDDWMTEYEPDVVLVMLGLNDVTLQWRGLDDGARNQTPAELADGAIDQLRQVVQKITASGAQVLLASPPSLFLQLDGILNANADANSEASVAALAQRIPQLAQEFGSNVTFVDIFNEIDIDRSVSADGRFLTDEIYNQIASSWYNALVPVLEPDADAPTREKAVVIEAEAFTTISPLFEVETVERTQATVLSLKDRRPFQSSENIAASASTDPGLPAGKYDIILTYFDQAESQAQFQVRVENTIFPAFKTKLGNEPKEFTSSAPDQLEIFDAPKNYTLKTIATEVDILPGDSVTINFLTEGRENLSFDNIRFVRVGDTDAPLDINTQPGGNPNIDGGSGIGGGTTGGNSGGNSSSSDVVTDIVTGDRSDTVGRVADPLKLSFKGNRGDRIIGTKRKDRLRGTGKNDILKGKNGNDNINAKGGNDRVQGGNGKDNLKGGGGSDFLRGDKGRDKLIGGGGDDLLLGGNDNDRDILRGGGGADSYQFKKLMNKADNIVGFQPGSDIIDMRKVLSGSAYAVGTGFEKFTEFVELVSSNGGTAVRVDPDGVNGNDAFKTLAIVKGVQPNELVSTDFAI